ncbi:hypothetical protein BJY01DRAFT_99498 [Aspergillus pseudoustus]|uniref:Zn(2)-C6 fungal-type domain-containing protein n=1 Tax=Aspergillus pseudoustus TaxID=1810923 RepID=A0ABR4IYB1_9EURO
MARRTHRKSRNGCLECKRRHVKCDERQPVCSNCTTSERVCEYSSRFVSVPPRSPLPRSLVQSAPPTPASDSAGAASPGTSNDPAPVPFSDQPVNMLHVELFHNLYTQVHLTFDPTGSLTWLPEIIRHSITTPYFVNAMLAFSALHMSTTRPDRREFYRYHAAQLQTHALVIFKELTPQVNQETCVPLFLFAAILGIHMLCDTLIYREGDFSDFITRFVHFFRVYYGVRAIIGEAWHIIQDTPLAPSFNLGQDLYKWDGNLNPGCAKLHDAIARANLGEDLTATYRRAVQSLQACFNVAEGTHEWHASINGVTTWPILLSIEFGDLLEQGRPEALVILAHYALLLHRFRDSWLFGDSGRFVIEEVTRHLGQEWEEWLQWPNEVLRSQL